MSYSDEEAAEAAYGDYVDTYKEKLGEPKKLDLGKIGDNRDAWVGLGSSFEDDSKAVLAEMRVGSVILEIAAAAGPNVTLTDSLIKDLAAVFVERARQAQKGEVPSASLDSS
ncbi:hypothetical protein [Streptomyces sp. NPDC051776]|uniref:hypothetical protein n=1 Tax=Streptomyces sp. NPDC051776 TaxID=3155414 RepID=UPI00341BEEE1